MSVTVMKMNLRGVYFEVNIDTLSQLEHSRLSRLSHGEEKVPLDSKGCYFYDRNPELFNSILDYYHTGNLHFPEQFSWNQVKDELEFWEIETSALSETCKIRFAKEREFDRLVRACDAYKDRYALLAENGKCKGLSAKTKKIWTFLEMPRSSVPAMIYAVLMYVIMPFISVFNSSIHTTEQFSKFDHHFNATTNETHLHHVHTDDPRHKAVVIVGMVTTYLILLELIIRFISWPNKRKFFCNSFNWFDILGLVFPIIHFYVVRYVFHMSDPAYGHVELKPRVVMFSHLCLACCTFRLFRAFRIWSCYDTYRTTMLAIKYTASHFFLTFCILVAFVKMVGYFIYATQAHIQGTQIDSAFKGAWFAGAVLATTGFGDVVPLTPGGRWLTTFSEGLGILMLAMPTVAFVHNYSLAARVLEAARSLSQVKARKELPVGNVGHGEKEAAV